MKIELDILITLIKFRIKQLYIIFSLKPQKVHYYSELFMRYIVLSCKKHVSNNILFN